MGAKMEKNTITKIGCTGCGVATRLKSKFFEVFLHSAGSYLWVRKISKNVDLAFV